MTYVYCGLLDHLYCDRSVICRLSGEDTEWNQFLSFFEVGVLYSYKLLGCPLDLAACTSMCRF